MQADAGARQVAARLYTAAATVLALGIFILDVSSPLQGAVAVLYTTVVLIAARSQLRDIVLSAGVVSAALALVAYFTSHWHEPPDSPAMRLAVSLVAIGITTVLSVRHQLAAEGRRRSDERYRTIFNAAGFPIWESDWSAAHAMLRRGAVPTSDLVRGASPAVHVLDANDAAARLFGYRSRHELIGGNIIGHFTSSGQTTLAGVFAGLMRGETAIEEEMQFQTLTGDTVDVVLRVSLPPDHDGWKHVLVMALDVTERKRTQERLAEAQAELTHVSRITTLGQLAASIAHEVNQPLSAIVTYARSGKRWLAREAPHAPEVADCLDHIAANGTRAADVIARIRDLARKADRKPALIDLPPLIDETVALLRRDLQAHAVDIRMSVPQGLPAVSGDRIQLQQVLMNLMLNAGQAMAHAPRGERALDIDLASEDGAVLVGVRDHGPGLAGIDPERLFSPFFTTKPDGMGIGLSICRSIAEQHGGTLIATDHPQGGATFRLRLPSVDSVESTAA